MKHRIYILLAVSILVCSCRDYKSKCENTIINDNFTDEYKFVSYNYCSPDLLFDEDVYGNTMINITSNDNFLKCMAISDSEFVFSCGRGKIEIVLFKTECGLANKLSFDGLSLPKLMYDDDDIMILYHKAGSDSWVNYFIHFSKKNVYSAQALYIDNWNRKYVYLDCQDYKNSNVFFIVHDIEFDTRDTIKSNYYKFKKDGYPALCISDVFMSHDTLFYSVDNYKDTIIR
jgi:hypothetical protein